MGCTIDFPFHPISFSRPVTKPIKFTESIVYEVYKGCSVKGVDRPYDVHSAYDVRSAYSLSSPQPPLVESMCVQSSLV